METVQIIDVNGPNPRDWYDVELSDGRTVTTKDRDLATTAALAKGSTVSVDVTTRKKGQYTNHYLNKIEAATADAVAASAAPSPPAPEAAIAPSREDERQARIAAQWAFGRAVEALAAGTLDDLLDSDTFEKVQKAANNLLKATSK